ncbi:class I SAM-dependent methyltransferase [Cohnella fermenti]|uniref:SAM-dependent methyltransferase n=1 Tax=Cohnella fermenti TaxID=2565925 RepID=A0A4V3WEB4_9BACL|nr:SAM-dependent methyltransferase [Cohnella fermenti]THF75612.1 SAM-dependent methyltransferase [Cohnella fermenti]
MDYPVLGIVKERILASERMGLTEGGRKVRGIPFRDYMAVCLYDPGHGYYSGGKPRVGREGDFYTSSFVGEVFASCLARRLSALADELFAAERPVKVIDWGGGTGRLGAQLLSAWERDGVSRFSLTVVDGNPVHRRLAAELLGRFIADGRAQVLSPEEAEAGDPSREATIIVANELLDAMPVHRIMRRDGRLRECGTAWDAERNRPIPCLLELPDALKERLEREGVQLREGQSTELGLDAEAWLARLAAGLGEALLVFVDYGDETEELTAAHRMNGTFVCYRDHVAFDDPYFAPGEQDMTAHVDFARLRRAAREAGLTELWYGSQLRFLKEAGLLQELVPVASADPFHPDAKRNRAIRQLLLSDGMSELFKVQIFRKEGAGGGGLAL